MIDVEGIVELVLDPGREHPDRVHLLGPDEHRRGACLAGRDAARVLVVGHAAIVRSRPPAPDHARTGAPAAIPED